jgi:hypothetical protein
VADGSDLVLPLFALRKQTTGNAPLCCHHFAVGHAFTFFPFGLKQPRRYHPVNVRILGECTLLLGSFEKATRFLHAVSLFVVAVIGVFAVSYTVMCAFGLASWFTLSATFGIHTFPDAGFYLQIVITALVGSLLFFIPANARILALEQSHRNFQIRMEDVAKAYHYVHTADRAGMFTLSSEFDAVRERLSYLRDHPDLDRLEPGVMEVAAQMSQQARHLADVYNNDKVARAKDFLRQRQEEAELQQERIVEALHACTEIRKWAQQVELEESIVASQLAQLDEQLQSALPALGYSLEHEPAEIVEEMVVGDDQDDDIEEIMQAEIHDRKVVNLPQKPAAE